jgi:hypothetical protein
MLSRDEIRGGGRDCNYTAAVSVRLAMDAAHSDEIRSCSLQI